MATQAVSMRLARAPEGTPRRARVREVTGADEMAVDGAGTATALAMLARVAEVDGAAVSDLAASDRDRLLAVVYGMTFGDDVRSSPSCAACGKPFDVTFSLAALMDELASRAQVVDGALAPPDARAEVAAGELGREEGIAALAVASGVPPYGSIEAAAAALEREAPIVDLDLAVKCPECDHPQDVAFDLQSFLLQRFLLERRRLTGEVHTLAAAYGWSLAEILAMPRRMRRRFIATIEEAERRAAGMQPWAAR
ncbi:MAG: hypothetical protein U1F54_00155 [Burkholderiales bacterium]